MLKTLNGSFSHGSEAFYRAEKHKIIKDTADSLFGTDDLAGTRALFDPLDFAGTGAAAASQQAAAQQQAALEQALARAEESKRVAQGFFEPFQGLQQQGIDQASFLANPEEQFAFLQNNPLFDLALENANRQTLQGSASQSRVSAGDTLTRLADNVLLSASPLIDRQRQDVGNLLNLGTNLASSQANIETGQSALAGDIVTDIGNVGAAGTIGASNARTAGAQNIGAILAKIFGGA